MTARVNQKVVLGKDRWTEISNSSSCSRSSGSNSDGGSSSSSSSSRSSSSILLLCLIRTSQIRNLPSQLNLYIKIICEERV